MSGLEKEASVETIASKIHTIMAAYDARMIGIIPESLALVVKEALK